ncbi:MAG: phosphoglycolate phosphatase [Acidobacteria bacterium]|nr:phosphoglycolate phosphatase [Acidobacteriota bacterium]
MLVFFGGIAKAPIGVKTMSYHCLLFDLDGTLVDSRADLANSVNLMLAELGRDPLSSCRVLNFVGEGARLLVERSLTASSQLTPQPDEVDRALKIFRRHYREHLLDYTRVYPEVEETLALLRHLPKAVVTNKPYEFSVALLEGLGMLSQFKVVLGGDSLPERKPSPMMLLEAARGCGVEPSACLMVGDTKFDVSAGRAAGMKTCGYIPGFRGRTELAEAGADFLIERFSELCVLVECAQSQFLSESRAVASAAQATAD